MATPDPLAPFREHPDRAGILLDFDGTLAPIVDDPARARPLPEAAAVIHRLAHRYRRVGVVSGRPADFLARHLGVEACADDPACPDDGDAVVTLFGLYGLERAEAGEVRPHPDAEEWREVVERAAAEAEAEAPEGVVVERKGLSVVLHHRTAPRHADWVHDWGESQAERSGLALHGGRMSEELRPPLPVDKGTVVSELAEGLRAVCFLGDDRGDLTAFAALARLADAGVHTVRVGVRSGESPDELLEEADVLVDGPEGALDLLRRLL